MKFFFAINGSPRKNCNTAQLIDKSLEGIKSIFPDATTEKGRFVRFSFLWLQELFCMQKN